LYGLLAFQEISFGKNRERESKDRYYQADLYYVLLWNLLNGLPYHASKANPSTDFFQTLSYIHPTSVDFVATDFQLKHCSRLPCMLLIFTWSGFDSTDYVTVWNKPLMDARNILNVYAYSTCANVDSSLNSQRSIHPSEPANS
jgi:hypothetical protein